MKNLNNFKTRLKIAKQKLQSNYKNTNNDEGTTYIPMKCQTAAIASVHDEEKDTVVSINSSSSECEENVDPRAALMALLKK